MWFQTAFVRLSAELRRLSFAKSPGLLAVACRCGFKPPSHKASALTLR
ncbi:MAG: hypothetical protein PHC77_07450 [Candidatus Marinimicrobia bacterium]|nr:hypothetical protein [Candidatus Neomarinimicrobiota bacterium]